MKNPTPLLLSLPILLLACRSADKDEEVEITDSGDTPEETAEPETNTPPTVDEIVLTPNPATTQDVVTANATTNDADGDAVTLDYVWFVNSQVIDDVGNELSGEIHFEKGDAVTVSVTPHDGEEYGPSLSAGPITIANSPPTSPGISISDEGDLMGLIDAPSEDPDGDPITYTFEWAVDGSVYTQATTTTETGDTVPYADTDGAQKWTLTVTPHDGEESGPAASTSLILEARSCAFQFEDDSSVLWVNSDQFGIGQQDFTLEFWIDPGSEIGDWGTIFRTSEGSSQVMRVTVGTDDAKTMNVDTVLSQSAGYCEEPNDGPDASIPRDGEWHHVAIVRSGPVLYTYLNGVLSSTGDLTWSGCSCGTSDTPCIAENGPGLFGQTAPAGVAIGPMRFSQSVDYNSDFEPATNWTIDSHSIAQWNTDQCFDGTTLPDAAGGNNHGTDPTGITAVAGP